MTGRDYVVFGALCALLMHSGAALAQEITSGPASDTTSGPISGTGRGRPTSSAQQNPELARGTIRVRVIDAEGVAQPGANVLLGVMKQESKRDKVPAVTDAQGIAVFRDLPVGTSQAYRVNVPAGRATYSSTPFQLPLTGGYDVTIVRLPTTEDAQSLVLAVGQLLVEQKDERLHVTQQARLVNVGQNTVVFPEDGLLIKLPKGATAFQSQAVMTDQRFVEEEGEGFRILGSVPPASQGEVVLTWAFDVPVTSSDMSFEVPLPWKTFMYRVLVEAPQGLHASVEGMPEMQLFDEHGQRVLVTQVQQAAGEATLSRVVVRITGIPGPGPLRWVAVAFAFGLVALGVVWAVRGPRPQKAASAALGGARYGASAIDDLQKRKQDLLALAHALEQARERGEIGPQYYAERIEHLTEQLAFWIQVEKSTRPNPRSADNPVAG
jgi:hypothetical protein